MPATPLYTSPFLQHKKMDKASDPWKLPDDWHEKLLADEGTARAFLLETIRHAPEEIVTVLQAALHAPSSEVSHIAAASLMKMHRQYESALVQCEEKCQAMPDNAQLKRERIMAIKAYRESGLNDSETDEALKAQEIGLLRSYLTIRASDDVCRMELVQLEQAQTP